MSYILDALKKAEKERRRNAGSELLGAGDGPAAEGYKRQLWPYLLIAALLINAGVFLWSSGPWTSRKGPTSTVSKDKQSGMVAAKESFDSKRIAKTVQEDNQNSSLSEDSRDNARAGAVPNYPSEPQRQNQGRKIASAGAAAENSGDRETAAGRKSGKTGGGNRIYTMNDLPTSVLSGLPDLSLSLHYFNADRSSRLVNVKGKTLKEGQEFAPGLRLEEITPDGAIFSYEDYRFRIGVNPQ